MKTPVRVAVTGAAGQIGYSLLFRIASGQMLGEDQPVILQLLDITPAMDALKGVAMELEDCAFPLLSDIVRTDDPNEAFGDISYALLVGARPRSKGMERKDLLEANGGIFKPQGKALSDNAGSDVKILVVGNPANTNALIAMNNAPNIPNDRFTAMTRLDHNRAIAQIAAKTGTTVSDITKMTIWGNHSATQYPDFYNAKINGKPAADVIGDENWLQNEFISTVQKRGAAVIEARGASSAGSAANAIIDTVKAVVTPTAAGTTFSAAVCSDGSYGVDEGLLSSFPLTSDGNSWTIVQGQSHNAFAQAKIDETVAELKAERDTVKDLLA